MPDIHPFLWFDDQAEEAAEFYVSVFPNSRVTDVVRLGEGAPGPGVATTVRFELDGKAFVALNGGPAHHGFNLGVSFVVDCASSTEVDHYWDALTGGGGEESACGWLKDRFGLSWQIVPSGLPAVLGDPDPVRAERATKAMLAMQKLDVAAMAAAGAGDGTDGRVAVSRWIDAPADALFDVLSDPSRHAGLDASGMLRSSQPMTIKAVGDEFVVDMHNDQMDRYVISNLVTEYEPGRRIAWDPMLVEVTHQEHQDGVGKRAGARWGWEFLPTGPDHTIVTEFFDCSRCPQWLRDATRDGEQWRPVITESLAKLAAADLSPLR